MMNYLIQEGNAKQSEKHEGELMPIAQALRQEGIKKGGEKQASIKISVSVSVKWHGETICEAINGSDGD